MTRKPRWTESYNTSGVATITFDNYRWFFEYIEQEMLEFKTYIYRGERDSSRPVISSLDRQFKNKNTVRTDAQTRNHLSRFKLASRGRLSSSISDYQTDEDWWSLGQHFGLHTPMLDWTESPFVACFFAFEKEKSSSSGYRIVYALSRSSVSGISKRLVNAPSAKIYNPMVNDNSRLVNQRGSLLMMPPNTDIENYITANSPQNNKDWDLIKLCIPDKGRTTILNYLNKMNINKLTLFPDLMGASEYANTQLEIPHY